MAVEDILKRIKADAEEAARKIVSEAQEAADVVAGEARARAQAQKKELRAKAEQRAQEERNRITTLARLASRRALLEEKQGFIDRVFDEAGKKIAGMDQGQYRKFITGLLKSSVESGDEEVLIGETERRIDQAYLDSVSKEAGWRGGLRLSGERRQISGGFILRSGRVETNCALETILRDAREKLETEVAAILFGGNGE